RRRAAIGLSEETDAVVVVVSEETSRISVAYGGSIDTGVDAERLRQLLERTLPKPAGLSPPPYESA
ncbi:MAG: diadenylate cyclase, partial [Gemmatimonadota bacterium]|nr:diadenylate cyclase [Gemmatimonadota bacterium]